MNVQENTKTWVINSINLLHCGTVCWHQQPCSNCLFSCRRFHNLNLWVFLKNDCGRDFLSVFWYKKYVVIVQRHENCVVKWVGDPLPNAMPSRTKRNVVEKKTVKKCWKCRNTKIITAKQFSKFIALFLYIILFNR